MKRLSRTIATAAVAAALAFSPFAVTAASAAADPDPQDTPTETATQTATPTPTPTVTSTPEPAPVASCTISATSTSVGSSVTHSCTGLAPGTVILITVSSADPATPSSAISIAGEQSTSKTAGADGLTAGVITLTAAGTYTITVLNVSTNAVLSSHTVTAVARAAAPSTLSSTGVDPLPTSLGAAALIALGTGIVLLARRRRAV